MSGVERLRELLAEATGRPWRVRTPGGFRWAQVIAGDAEDDPVAGGLNDDDAALIVAAVNALPSLLAVYDAAETVGQADAGDDAFALALAALAAAVAAVKEGK